MLAPPERDFSAFPADISAERPPPPPPFSLRCPRFSQDYLALWFYGVNTPTGSALTAPDPTLPSSVPPQHIEACLGFGCGQCKNRTYGPYAVLPYQLGGKPQNPFTRSGIFHRKGQAGSGAPGDQPVSAKGVAFALARRMFLLAGFALILIVCADRVLLRRPRRCVWALRRPFFPRSQTGL